MKIAIIKNCVLLDPIHSELPVLILLTYRFGGVVQSGKGFPRQSDSLPVASLPSFPRAK